MTGFSYDAVDTERYAALRPDYAPASVEWLRANAGLDEGDPVELFARRSL
ncbi:MAG TPA: hypothetical protein VEM93_10350 [Actinomycetota bacterium]|nr:hypothetical protein [Actinomycetota bacterium]